MRATRLVAAIALSCLLVGCPAVDWKELQFTRKKPSEEHIIGTWRPTADTLKNIRGRGHYPEATHEIILRADHTFTIRNMPDWWSDGFGESRGQFESGDGKWALEARRDMWQIWVLRLDFPSVTTSVNLYRQRSPYVIFIRIGDPNNGDVMFFERIRKET